MNVRIAGGDRPVRAHGTSLSPIGLLPASDNAKWVGMLVSFALGLILSTAHIADSPAPFGLAFLAAMGYGSGGALCLVGCALGYFAAFGVASGTQLAAGCCLTFLTAYFLRSRPFVQTRWYPPLVSAAAYIPTRLVLYLLTGGVSLLLISRMALFLILCAGAAYGFDDLLRAQEPRTANAEICRNVSAVFLLACLLMGVNNLLLFDTLSVGRALSVLILLVLSGTGGALCGASAGVILGIAMDVAAGDGVLFSVVYAAAGLLSGQFCKHRRGFFLSTFAAAYLLALFCVPLPALRIGASAELLLAVGAYLVLPKKFVVAVGAFLQPMRAGSGESGLRRYVAGRVGGMAHAYQQLHDTASQAAAAMENDADAAKIFDRAADRVCCRCKLQQECWTRRALDTLNIMNDATRRIQTRGRLLPDFRDRCVYLHEYTEVVNGELRLRAYRQRMQETLQENRTVLWQQYADFAQVLTNVSRELDSGYGADPLAEQRLIRYLRTVGVEADAAVFRESTGRLRVTIDSRYLRPLLELPDYLDKLSAALGVRLCMPEDSARGDSLLLLEAEPLAVSVGIASMRKKGEAVSGDRGTYFKTDAGQLCVILSDGMGCGESAADGSIGTVGMLEEFLRSGVSPTLAMKLLNSAMLLRDGENWGYATVDLMCMNLFTGEADFYKYGAAPTYVKSGGALKKLRCTSFAPGLEQESGKAPDELHMHLKPGSVAVIASDGVVSDGQDLWLRRLLNDFEDGDMKTLAGSVVRAAIREYGRGDDMTALAVKVEVRS
jgi:stage II sporulation protein E